MNGRSLRSLAKEALGRVPLAAATYQSLVADNRVPSGGFDLDRLASSLPEWIAAADRARERTEPGQRQQILIIANLKWWLEHAIALGLLLYAQGNSVDLGYLPYRRWSEPVSAFDRRRQSVYLSRMLAPLGRRIGLHDLSRGSSNSLPHGLAGSLEDQSLLDVQYTLQREILDFAIDQPARELLGLRRQRNQTAAGAILALLSAQHYDTIIIPNGSILEFGAAYRTARWRGVPVVTYEFGEQRERIWLAQDQEVMRLPTDDLWAERGSVELTEREQAEIEGLYQARRAGSAWSNFTRRWQKGESAGAARARVELELDPTIPMVLLCTNVVGDSLALDRQLFTRGMADWLEESVRFFAAQGDCQLIVRAHPGELLGAGHPSVDIVQAVLPAEADRVRVIPPDSPINTYDLIELAHLGLAYTTTVGMEMAMFGVPVIVAGDTHYRRKGFTDDPSTLEAYWLAIERRLAEPLGRRLSQEQLNLAWRYAHRFFFEFPFPFPWHLITFWDDVAERPFGQVVESEGPPYRRAMEGLSGHPIHWADRSEAPLQERMA